MREGPPPADPRAYPARPIVGVGAVVIRDGAVLLVQRGREPLLGRWSLPGGALELGETLREGVAREVWEETGLRVTAQAILATLDRIVRDEEGRTQYHYVLIDWLCEVDASAGEPAAGDDASAVRWVALENVNDVAYGLEDTTLNLIEQARALGRRADSKEGAR